MERILINFLGALLGLAITMLFFRTIWVMKKTNFPWVVLGISVMVISNVVLTPALLGTVLLPLVNFALIFMISFYFSSGILAKVLFSLIVMAISFGAEVLVAWGLTRILEFPIDLVQNSAFLYFVGVVTSNMTALIFVLIIRIILEGYRKEAGNQYNLIILLMPTQAIIICFLVYFYSISGSEIEVSPLGMSAILTSLSLVFLSIFIVKSLQRAIAYKEDYKLAEERLDSQLNEYRKLYFEQEEARKERHDMSNNLIALTGTLEDGRIQEAIDRMKSINATINKPDILMKTGIPEIDAVINAKLSRANKHDINLISKVKVGHALKINAYDFSRIIANALDNAIEGIERSSDVKREIYLNINCTANFVSLIVENYASGLVNANFQTSKPDKINHGFGMTQMKTITEKYDGDFQPEYDHKSGKFLLKILLKNRKI